MNRVSFQKIVTWIFPSKLSFFEYPPDQNSIYREWIESSKIQLCWRWSLIQSANKTSTPWSFDLAWRIYTVIQFFIPILICKFFSYRFSFHNTWKETLRLPEPWTETIATSYCIIWKRVNDNSKKCDEWCYSVSSKKFSSVSFYVVYVRKRHYSRSLSTF